MYMHVCIYICSRNIGKTVIAIYRCSNVYVPSTINSEISNIWTYNLCRLSSRWFIINRKPLFDNAWFGDGIRCNTPTRTCIIHICTDTYTQRSQTGRTGLVLTTLMRPKHISFTDSLGFVRRPLHARPDAWEMDRCNLQFYTWHLIESKCAGNVRELYNGRSIVGWTFPP